MINKDRVRPDPAKLSAVENFPIPPNAKNIRQGTIAGYYHWFISGFSKITSLLCEFIKKERDFCLERRDSRGFRHIAQAALSRIRFEVPKF